MSDSAAHSFPSVLNVVNSAPFFSLKRNSVSASVRPRQRASCSELSLAGPLRREEIARSLTVGPSGSSVSNLARNRNTGSYNQRPALASTLLLSCLHVVRHLLLYLLWLCSRGRRMARADAGSCPGCGGQERCPRKWAGYAPAPESQLRNRMPP